MARNITLRLDDGVLKQARRAAMEQDQSVSQWVANLITDEIRKNGTHKAARRRSLKALDKTFQLGGTPLARDEIYERRPGLR
jgi:hypothetical protein